MERFQREQEEEKQALKERREAHLYAKLRIATHADIASFGPSNYTRTQDFHNFNKMDRYLKWKRAETVAQLLQALSVKEEYGAVPVERQRLWTIVKRENKTTRPDENLTGEEQKTIEQICDKHVRSVFELQPINAHRMTHFLSPTLPFCSRCCR